MPISITVSVTITSVPVSQVGAGGAAPSGGASLILTWTDTSALETGFRVEISTDGISYSTHGTVAANVETYEIDGLDFNTLYYIRVIAFNGVGDSSTALEAEAYTAPPLAPTGLTATITSPTTATIDWTLPATEPVTGYRLRYSLNGGPLTLLTDVAAGVDTYAATGLEPSGEYTFTVSAYNENGAYTDQETAQTDPLAVRMWPALLATYVETSGDVLRLEFSEPMEVGAGGSDGLSLAATGGAVTATYTSGDGDLIRYYSLSRTITQTEDVEIDHTNPGNGLETVFDGRDLDDFADVPVFNQSTAANYFVNEDFPGATAPVTAGFSSSGTVTYTGDRANLDSNFAEVRWTFASTPLGGSATNFSFYAIFQPKRSTDMTIWFGTSSGGNIIVTIKSDRLTVVHGTGVTVDKLTTVSESAPSEVWIDIISDSGASDGVITIALNNGTVSGNRPTGSAQVTQLTSGVGGPVTYMRYRKGSVAGTCFIDNVRMSLDPIGNNPS